MNKFGRFLLTVFIMLCFGMHETNELINLLFYLVFICVIGVLFIWHGDKDNA